MDDAEKAENRERTIHHLQILEQNLQQTMLQKQAFQMELGETQAAIKEIEKSGDDVFKIIGQLMIKSEKKAVMSELANKEKLINLRIRALEKQEETFSEKIDSLQHEIME